jgi:hypothetical protein
LNFAPVAQWIEQWVPNPRAQVRFLPGVLHDFRPLVIGTTFDASFLRAGYDVLRWIEKQVATAGLMPPRLRIPVESPRTVSALIAPLFSIKWCANWCRTRDGPEQIMSTIEKEGRLALLLHACNGRYLVQPVSASRVVM